MTANAGFHAYTTGDVLTASQVQFNLQNQTIMYFADSAARSSALSAVLVEGMFTYLADTDSFEYYDSSAWNSVSNPGDISAVTAGVGLSGGGISGDVTLDLADTAVVAGSYNTADITVDAQGRITAATSGVAATDPTPTVFLLMGA